jgi:hypothetical protein
MAKNNQQPQFLGGGPKFNAAGAQPPAKEVTEVPEAPPPNRMRTWLIVILLIVLIGILYAIIVGPNGLTVKSGRGAGISPTQHTTGPDDSGGP